MRVCAQTTFIVIMEFCIFIYKVCDHLLTPIRIGRRISKGDTQGIRLNIQGNKQEY